MTPVLVPGERIDAAITAAPAHLKPVLAAVKQGAAFLAVPQDAGPFRPQRGRPTIVLLGDDLESALGPDAFHEPSVRRVLRQAAAIAVVSAAPEQAVYAATVGAAIMRGGFAVIIETRPAQEIAWLSVVRREAPHTPTLNLTVRGGQA